MVISLHILSAYAWKFHFILWASWRWS